MAGFLPVSRRSRGAVPPFSHRTAGRQDPAMMSSVPDPTPRFYENDGLHVAVYDAFHEQSFRGTAVEGDVAWYVARALEWGGPVLEAASGTGRVSLALADAGLEVVGFDLSPAMRATAERKRTALAPAAAARASFLPGDLREFDLGRTFPVALVPFRSFQCLLDPPEQVASLGAFHRHLVPGGRLVLDLFDPVYEYLTPAAVEREGERSVVATEWGTTVTVGIRRLAFDPFRQRFHDRWTFRETNASGAVLREEEEDLEMRWTFRHELHHLLARAGFAVEAEYADFLGSPPEYGKELVVVARRD